MNFENKPFFSVITVTLNSEKFLEQTIKSVINQGISNIEYIIIDGGSTDGTIDIIKKYSNFITYWVSEKDNGIYDAINKGILVSKGKYIGIINSDDWYEENSFNYINQISCNENSEIIHGILRLWDNDNKIGLQGYTSNFLKNGMISHPTCFINRNVYFNVSLYDTQYKIAADYDFMLKCYLKNNINFNYQENIIANFRLSGVSNKQAKLRRIETNKILYNYKLISKKTYFLNKLKLIF
jgi:glycosyltransferase involved in cell wall biosynthesis